MKWTMAIVVALAACNAIEEAQQASEDAPAAVSEAAAAQAESIQDAPHAVAETCGLVEQEITEAAGDTWVEVAALDPAAPPVHEHAACATWTVESEFAGYEDDFDAWLASVSDGTTLQASVTATIDFGAGCEVHGFTASGAVTATASIEISPVPATVEDLQATLAGSSLELSLTFDQLTLAEDAHTMTANGSAALSVSAAGGTFTLDGLTVGVDELTVAANGTLAVAADGSATVDGTLSVTGLSATTGEQGDSSAEIELDSATITATGVAFAIDAESRQVALPDDGVVRVTLDVDTLHVETPTLGDVHAKDATVPFEVTFFATTPDDGWVQVDVYARVVLEGGNLTAEPTEGVTQTLCVNLMTGDRRDGAC